ncbi:hypothetical protein [Gorillibacterium sp. sgz500922]|uniref:hypothetical protein n=1 Tax=Gorillibacterium sp. sgz500922 TaxID=3446694 RepID=UPI003F6753C6
MLRQQAENRLQAIQAQMFQLGEEAKVLTAFLNLSAQEEQERYQQEQMQRVQDEQNEQKTEPQEPAE